MKSPYYLAGFICAIVVVGGIYLAVMLKQSKANAGKRFDEMQLIARQKAAMHGFVLLIALTFLGGIIGDLGWLSAFDTAVVCIFAAVTVFGCECILRNAYFRAGEESRPWLFIIGSLTVLNAVAVARHVYDGTFTESILNLCCAVGLGAVLVVNLIQRGRNKLELEDE